MGVFLCLQAAILILDSLPHARGGVSALAGAIRAKRESSPRTWGCFHRHSRKRRACRVFPTHVGVFLLPCHFEQNGQRLPHARGGVSCIFFISLSSQSSSPRTWGCFYGQSGCPASAEVFPTHVGVFLRPMPRVLRIACLPHARGGVSAEFDALREAMLSSPRTWGCFRRADARARADSGLPQARGGVSAYDFSKSTRAVGTRKLYQSE